MCVEWVNEWEIASEPITAYKVVRKNGKRFESPTTPGYRANQGRSDRGSVLEYPPGETVVSEEPGIYCISHPILLAEKGMTLVEVVIPKGARFRRGRANVPDEKGQLFEMRTLNPLVIRVIGEYHGPIDKQFNWPVAPSTTPAWTYVTTSCTSTTIYVTSTATAGGAYTYD